MTQNEMVLEYLEGHKEGLTSLEALQMFGCSRLASRVADLRRQGHRVQSELIRLPNGKRVAQYRLEVEG